MRFKKANINQVAKAGTFHAQYHLDIEPIKKRYNNHLNKKFKGCDKLPFSKIANKISRENQKKGDILLRNFPDGKLFLLVLKTKPDNKLSNTVYRIIDSRISAEYLIWYLSHNEVKNYLKVHATGGVIRTFPLKLLNELLIPIPKVIGAKQKKSKVSFVDSVSPLREIIRHFYQDYKDNYEEKRYEAAIILAGAICEAILYEALVDEGVTEDLLSQKTFGTLIEFAKVKELDKLLNINLTHFENIKKQRNSTIHIGSSLQRYQKGEIINKDAFIDFDHIIKNFGI